MNTSVTEFYTPELLQTVLDHSLTNIYAAKAIRNSTTGELVDFQIYFANPAFVKRTHRSEDDWQTHTLLTLFPTLTQTGFFDHYRHVVETGEPFEGEQEYPGPNGHFWYQTSVKKWGDGIVVNFVDITDRRRAEETIRQQHDLLNGVLNTFLSAITICEPIRNPHGQAIDFRITWLNEGALQLTPGISRQNILGHALTEIFPDIQEWGILETLQKVYQSGEFSRSERYYSPVLKWLDVSVQRISNGLLIAFNDITDRKLAEQQLQQTNQLLTQIAGNNKEQAEQLTAMLDASISSILAMTAIRETSGQIVDFRIDKANRAVERSLNKTPQELEGHTLLAMFPGNIENGFFDLYAQAADTGVTQQATLHYTDVNGFEGWFQVCAVQQAPDKIVLTFMNVTESKQLEQRLRESNNSLGQFASVASHDLQEPLRKIATFGSMLMNEYASQLDERGAGLIDRMQVSTYRMQALIQDLLAYSRLSQSKELTRQPINLSQLVDEVLTDLEVTVETSRAIVTKGDLPILPGDSSQLRQAFQNLISNALKFTQPGQPPHVRIESRRLQWTDIPSDVNFAHKARQSYWQITVADKGIGFNETYRERIFGAFERLHGKSSPYSGTGIGLAITKRVIENHGGAITAQSKPGDGATFYLYLPA